MSARDEPSYLPFARAAVRNGGGVSSTVARELVSRIDRDASSRMMPTVVHIHHDAEAHARSFNEGYETAVAQQLAHDPSLADDWLQEKLREARASALAEAAEAMRAERQSWCLDDSGRYWIKRTLDDLAERAVAERGER